MFILNRCTISESFTFDFLLCGYDYTKAIGMLARERKGKDIVYIPHPRSRVSLGNKSREVKPLLVNMRRSTAIGLLTPTVSSFI